MRDRHSIKCLLKQPAECRWHQVHLVVLCALLRLEVGHGGACVSSALVVSPLDTFSATLKQSMASLWVGQFAELFSPGGWGWGDFAVLAVVQQDKAPGMTTDYAVELHPPRGDYQ